MGKFEFKRNVLGIIKFIIQNYVGGYEASS